MEVKPLPKAKFNQQEISLVRTNEIFYQAYIKHFDDRL